MSSEQTAHQTEQTKQTEQTEQTDQMTSMRRVGRVERWLRKGYGFIHDLGRLITNESSTCYGWTQDAISGSKVFVYHNALASQSDQVFHRLFAHEYVEYSIDTSRPTRESRHQAFDVTGLCRSLLLCDLNIPDEETSQASQASQTSQTSQAPQAPTTNRSQGRQSRAKNAPQQRQQQQQQQQQQPPQTVVYYVQAGTTFPFAPPPQIPQEPVYAMPTGGIPVPK